MLKLSAYFVNQIPVSTLSAKKFNGWIGCEKAMQNDNRIDSG